MSAHFAHLTKRYQLAHLVEGFVFTCTQPLSFRAGQFISIQVGLDAQHNPILRSYSIASSPDEQPQLLLIIRLLEHGPGSEFFRNLKLNDEIRFTGPLGFFVNDEITVGDSVYIGTGTGIAPLYPMIIEKLTKAPEHNVWLFWGCRHEQDIFWADKIRELTQQFRQLRVLTCLSQPSADYTGLTGRITPLVLNNLAQFNKPVFYLCGNGKMIQELKILLQSQGIERKKQIRTEAFFD